MAPQRCLNSGKGPEEACIQIKLQGVTGCGVLPQGGDITVQGSTIWTHMQQFPGNQQSQHPKQLWNVLIWGQGGGCMAPLASLER